MENIGKVPRGWYPLSTHAVQELTGLPSAIAFLIAPLERDAALGAGTWKSQGVISNLVETIFMFVK